MTPRKRFTSFCDFGVGKLSIAAVLDLHGNMPSLVKMFPRNFTDGVKKTHLFKDKVK